MVTNYVDGQNFSTINEALRANINDEKDQRINFELKNKDDVATGKTAPTYYVEQNGFAYELILGGATIHRVKLPQTQQQKFDAAQKEEKIRVERREQELKAREQDRKEQERTAAKASKK